MWWKLIDNVNDEIITRSTIHWEIEPGTANIQIDSIEPVGENCESTPDDDLHTTTFSLDNDNPIVY